MPKRIDKLPKPHRINVNWDLILNGEAWELERGIDYNCLISTFRVNLHNQCKRRKLKYKSHVSKDNENIIYVQAFPSSPELCMKCGNLSLFNSKTKQYIGCCEECMPF